MSQLIVAVLIGWLAGKAWNEQWDEVACWDAHQRTVVNWLISFVINNQHAHLAALIIFLITVFG